MGKGDISYKRVRRRAQRSSGRGMDSRDKSVYDRCVNLHEAVFGLSAGHGESGIAGIGGIDGSLGSRSRGDATTKDSRKNFLKNPRGVVKEAGITCPPVISPGQGGADNFLDMSALESLEEEEDIIDEDEEDKAEEKSESSGAAADVASLSNISGGSATAQNRMSSISSSVNAPSQSSISSNVSNNTIPNPAPACIGHLLDADGSNISKEKNRKKTKGLKKEVTMKITKRQLRRIINEALNEYSKADPPKVSPLLDMNASEQAKALANQPAADPAYVLRALEHHYNRGVHPSQRRGMPFGGMGVNPIMDALMIDDVWPEEEEALQKIVSDGGAQSLEELATMVADWLTKKRRGQLVTDEGMAKAMENWR